MADGRWQMAVLVHRLDRVVVVVILRDGAHPDAQMSQVESRLLSAHGTRGLGTEFKINFVLLLWWSHCFLL
jgi:hypothetical protein